MPSGFWDYIHLGRSRTNEDDELHHNLQEGLFQIASQTCNILVQVNNTNNITLGTNVHYNNFTPSASGEFSAPSTSSTSSINVTKKTTTFFDLEQSVVLLQPKQNDVPTTPTKGRFHRLSEYKRRLSVSWVNIIYHNFFIISKRELFYEKSHK